MKIILYLWPIGKLEWVLCLRQGHRIWYILSNLLPFSPETFMEIGVLQRISGRLMSWDRASSSMISFGFFFIRNNCWSNVRINFIGFPNCWIGDLSEFVPLCGSSFNFALIEEQKFDYFTCGDWTNSLASSWRNTASGRIYLVTLSWALNRR